MKESLYLCGLNVNNIMYGRVQVVIPVYQNQLSESEFHSLRQVCKVLKRYPLVIVKPESLDVSNWKEIYPLLEIESFPDEYFKGISGYNRLMLSELFYSRFVERTEYLLIYQLDAYVFRDELEDWCNKGYDYVGAPWMRRPVYNRLPVSAWMRLSMWYSRARKEPSRQDLYNKVGNGGFSLRHVAHHLAAIQSIRKRLHASFPIRITICIMKMSFGPLKCLSFIIQKLRGFAFLV